MSRPNETVQDMNRAAEAGEVLDLSRRGNNVVPATAIRDLLRSGDVDPRGLRVRGARITGRLDLSFVSTSTALRLDDCVFEEPLFLLDAELRALSLDGSTLPALHAENLRTRSLTMENTRCTGIIDLETARIDGSLTLPGATAGSLFAPGLQVGRSVYAVRLFASRVVLNHCDIGGDLSLGDTVIISDSSSAVSAVSAKIGGNVSFVRSFVKSNHDCSVVMVGATAGSLDMTGAVLRADNEPALIIGESRFRSTVYLDDGFNARSNGASPAAVQVTGSQIDGWFIMSGSVCNGGGKALMMHKMAISSSLSIRDGTVFEATSPTAAVSLVDCVVSGNLYFRPKKLVNHGDGYELSLSGTKVGDHLEFDVAKLMKAESFSVTVKGLTYAEPPANTNAWLTMLRERNDRYEAQPYQQLAAVHRAAGHEHTSRRVLIAQQRDLRRRGDPGNKLWHWFLGVTLGYGYRPSRAVIGLLVTFLLALCLVWTTNAYNGLTPAKDRPADACSPVNRISLAADLAIPLVKLGGTPRCELANGPAGQWATGAGWVVQILGWSFATLSVAGFTGLVRKS